MSRRRVLTAVGALLLSLALPVSVSGCACTAVMYLNDGPITVVFSEPLAAGATMAACFDAGCEPSGIAIDDVERVEVPQDEPYRSDDQVDPPREMRIVLTAQDGTVVHDKVHDIRTTNDNPFSPCSGPFHYEDVVVEA